jgi:hypothetical protein
MLLLNRVVGHERIDCRSADERDDLAAQGATAG